MALTAAEVPCGRVRDMAEVFADPQVLARDMVVTVEHPTVGDLRLTGIPYKLSGDPGVDPPPATAARPSTRTRSLPGWVTHRMKSQRLRSEARSSYDSGSTSEEGAAMIDHRQPWALILGASSGFGEATALALAAAGYDICGVHLDRRAGPARTSRRSTRRIEAHGRKALFFNGNAADDEHRAVGRRPSSARRSRGARERQRRPTSA